MAKSQAQRWVNQAMKSARDRVGPGGWQVMGNDLRHALAARELVVLLSAQEHANGETMREACSLLLEREAA